jgi:hypothetical protein
VCVVANWSIRRFCAILSPSTDSNSNVGQSYGASFYTTISIRCFWPRKREIGFLKNFQPDPPQQQQYFRRRNGENAPEEKARSKVLFFSSSLFSTSCCCYSARFQQDGREELRNENNNSLRLLYYVVERRGGARMRLLAPFQGQATNQTRRELQPEERKAERREEVG